MNNYRKGADKERRIVNELRSEGWVCARSAGSKSPIDIWAIDPKTNQILLIQCKSDKATKAYKKKLYDELKHLEGEFMVEVWIR